MADTFWVRFARVEDNLWRVAYSTNPDYVRQRRDCWVLCPRAHARAHLRCVLELTPRTCPGFPDTLPALQSQFSQVQRFYDGHDLVFAVGDVQ